MISHKHKCIFVHIPKTGGTSIERVIWPLESDRVTENLWHGLVAPHSNKYQTGGLQHLTSSFIETEVGADVFRSYFKFSVVRNPWDKAVSQYIYTKQQRRDLRRLIGMTRWTSFKKYLNLITKKTHVQWMKQIDFLTDANAKIIVDQIIRFENLEEETQSVLERLKIENTSLPHAKKSKRKHYTEYHDKDSIRMIEDLYGEDIETFDYSFGN